MMADEDVLVLTNEDMEGLLDMGEVVEAVETAYRELGRKIAEGMPRRRLHMPLEGLERTWYWLNVIPGAVPAFDTAAVRLDSSQIRFRNVGGGSRMEFPGDFAGFVLLFSIKDRVLKGIVHDHYLSALRVGATSGVAAKYLAREDASVLGIFGSGTQAHGQVAASVRGAEDSGGQGVLAAGGEPPALRQGSHPTLRRQGAGGAASRRRWCEDSDIVVTATNSGDPVFDGDWLEPGTHLVSMIGPDWFDKRRELDDAAIENCDLIVVNSKEQVEIDEQPELMSPLRKGVIGWEQVHELGDLVIGTIPGRTTNSEITHHNNNCGMGIQFAAIGHLVLEAGPEAQAGHPAAGRPVHDSADRCLLALRRPVPGDLHGHHPEY